jgi:hypothetical protein
MFRFLLGYAASAGPQSSEWPLDALGQRKNLRDGGNRIPGSGTAQRELRADVDMCLAVVRKVAGGGWLYDNILMPLANRTGYAALAETLAHISPAPTDEEYELRSAAAAMINDMLRRQANGASQGSALSGAVEAWLGNGRCPDGWAELRRDDLALKRLAKLLTTQSFDSREAA